MPDLSDYRYVILAEGHFGPLTSKTANSAIRYLPDRVLAVIDSTRREPEVDDVLGFGGRIPVLARLEDALPLGPTALLIGIAPQGGRLPDAFRPVLHAAMAAGLDIVSGLHFFLEDDPDLMAAASAKGVRIHDLRRPPPNLPVSTGKARGVDALVVHTVGTDCNIGKMTAALQIQAAMRKRGTRVGFAATGQTGILIEGWGIAVDAVVADFVGGAAEQLVLQAAQDNDVVLVEGQGSLVHPGYSGVTLGLLHGSMPDAQILCHQPTRECPYGGNNAYSWMKLPSPAEMVKMCEAAIAPLRRSPVIGVALNTFDLSDADALDAVARIQDETGLPTTDPVRFDPAPLVDAIDRARTAKSGVTNAPSAASAPASGAAGGF